MLTHKQSLAYLFLLFVCACKSLPLDSPLPPPPVSQSVSFYWGSFLSGPLEQPLTQVRSDVAIGIQASYFALRNLPDGELSPLSEKAKLITINRGDRAIKTAPLLTSGSRCAIGNNAKELIQWLQAMDPGGMTPMTDQEALALDGATAILRLEDLKEQTYPGMELPYYKKVEIQVHPRKNNTLQLGLLIQDRPSSISMVHKESIYLDLALDSEKKAALLVFPSPFKSSSAKAIAAVIEFNPQPKQDHGFARLLKESVNQLKPVESSLGRELKPEYGKVIEDLNRSQKQRRVLFSLANRTGALFAQELMMTATDAMVADLAKEVSGSRAEITNKNLGWVLESKAYLLAAAMLDESQPLPEVTALLSVHAGQAGQRSYLIRDLCAAADGLKRFQELLLHQNLVFLEDNAPAARIRAYDWLKQKNQAPKGYDPLASSKERRDALLSADQEDSIERRQEK